MAKLHRPRPGDVVEIDLADGTAAFGRVLESPEMAFYALRASDRPSVTQILQAPILFRVWVYRDAVASGRWRIIGHKPLDGALAEPSVFFKRGSLWGRGKGLHLIHRGGKEERPATREDVVGLEVAAVWAAEHVEDRLRDHFAGRSCHWVEDAQARALASDESPDVPVADEGPEAKATTKKATTKRATNKKATNKKATNKKATNKKATTKKAKRRARRSS